MIRNLLYSLLIHAFNGVAIWFLAGWSFDFFQNQNQVFTGSLYLLSILGLVIYFAFGSKFLHYLSPMKNITSLSLVSMIGIILWISCYYFSDGGLAWFIYLVYNAPIYPFLITLELEPENTLLFALIPSFILWTALALKHTKEKRRII
ncbi:hypothetical protein [Peribacillus sp. SCS-37]|uniref:hypothetical protein n=1 Tax=Paraperibacillus esterisolvens TaxID=3115296 RepID=UPI003905AD82